MGVLLSIFVCDQVESTSDLHTLNCIR